MTEDLLLDWLSREDSSLYGECRGATLDQLIEKGLATVGTPPAGRSEDHAPVSLTEAGWAAIQQREPQGSPDSGGGHG